MFLDNTDLKKQPLSVIIYALLLYASQQIC